MSLRTSTPPAEHLRTWVSTSRGTAPRRQGRTYADTITYTGAVKDAETGTTENVVDLSTLTGAYEAQDGDVLTGTLGSAGYKITVAAGATITLRNADITSIPNDTSYSWAGITPLGDATIILEGTNAVNGGYEDYPGIFAAENATLTIQGDGLLTASSNGYGAGIGSGYEKSCGNIVIEGGTITATGGDHAAGIGSGNHGSSCGTITITSSVTNVTATKDSSTPNSIGAGSSSSCGTVTIGGTVYWDGSSYQNGGDSYLTQSTLTYTPGS